MPTNTKHLDPVRLTTEDVIVVTDVLRQKAIALADLASRPYGRKDYREKLRNLSIYYGRLADAFAQHTVVTLAKAPASRAYANGRAVCHACGCNDSTDSMKCSNCGRTGHLTYQPD